MKLSQWLIVVVSAAIALSALPAVAATQGPLIGEWETVVTTGTYTPRALAASGLANNRIWIIGGVDSNGTVTDTVQGLYVLTRKWEDKSPMPTARRDAAAAVIDDKIYVIGGADQDGDLLSTVEVFDPKTDTWTTLADMPTARSTMAAVPYVVPGGVKQIHVYGSAPGAVFPENSAYEIYDVTTDQWTDAPRTAPSSQCEAAGVAAKDLLTGENYLYLFGGYSGGASVSPSGWRINPASDDGWEADVAEMPHAKIQCGVVTIEAAHPDTGSGQYPLLVGGNIDRSGTAFSASVLVYESGALNGWITGDDAAPDLPERRGNSPAAVVAGGRLWVVGGANDLGPATEVYRATINTGNYPPPPPIENPLLVGWESVADILTPRWYTVHAVVNDKLFVIGGWDASGGSPVGNNEMYDPDTDTWTAMAPMPVPVRGAACAAIDGKIYVAGGSKEEQDVYDFEDTLQIYDVATDTWTIGPPMPTGRDLVAGFTTQGKFHVVGGAKLDPEDPNSQISTSEHEVYDPATELWSTLDPPGLPWPLGDATAAVIQHSVQDWVYYGSGWWAATQLSLVARWNSVPGGAYNEQWYSISNLPVGGNSGATMIAVTDGTGAQWPAIFGGHFGPVGYFNKVFIYHDYDDPVFANRWLRDTTMPYGRGGRMAVAQIGNYVYVAAGMGPLGVAHDTWRSAIGSGLPKEVTRIREAIAQPNASRVSITEGKVVTRVYQMYDPQEQHIWIEESDRSSALRVGPVDVSVQPGNKVTITGRMGSDPTTGERILNPTSITVDPAVYDIPQPIGITNRSFIGGSKASQPGRADGEGLNNLGMLARIYGKVVAVPMETGFDGWPYFYIDDGSNLSDGTDEYGQPNVGIRVYHWWYVNPPVNSFVSATGIISFEKVDGKLVPMLLSDELTLGDSAAIVEY